MDWLMMVTVPFYGFIFTRSFLVDVVYTLVITGLFVVAGAHLDPSAWILGIVPVSGFAAKVMVYVMGSDSNSRPSIVDSAHWLLSDPLAWLYDTFDCSHQFRTSDGDAVVATKHISLMTAMAFCFTGVREVVPENDFPVGLVRSFLLLHAITMIAYLRNQSECEIKASWNYSLVEYDRAYVAAFVGSFVLFLIAWLTSL